MDFSQTARSLDLQEQLEAFMRDRVLPGEDTYADQLRAAGDPHAQPPVMEELKEEARGRGLWNLFHPDPELGPGLSNAEYAPLAEILGRSLIAPEACNCNAPDTGNMEVLSSFGTAKQKERWLRPLLAGRIRSAFAMTEPQVASSDATNIELEIKQEGAELVLNGRKWWITNVLHPNCRILIVMGKSDREAARHRQQSMVLVPLETPGVTVVRGLPVLGYQEQLGHAELLFEDVRVPVENLIANEGDGFMVAQARLGPGRIHHCMRAIGAGERALELLCRRARERVAFGAPIADRANIRDWIAEARVELEMARLLTLKAAWTMDVLGTKEARVEISAIKTVAPSIALKVLDRAIQVHGAGGLSDDFPLAALYANIRTLRIADGPDEVHRMAIARQELKRYETAELVA